MPATFLTARWLDVAALTYRVDPGLVQPYLPHGVEADLEDGAAQVSLVAFSFCDTSLGGLLPAPLHQRFAEVNLRVYVRRGSERAVTFVREYVPRRLVTGVARTFFNEPYATHPGGARSRMVDLDGDRVRHVAHRFGPGWGDTLDLWADPTPAIPPEGSIERRLTHHTVGFGRRHDGATLAYRVHHPVWALYPVRHHRLAIDVERLYGPQWGVLADSAPWVRTLAAGSPVALSTPMSLATFDAGRADRAAEDAPPSPTGRPALFYDADCGFCTDAVRVVARMDRDAQIDLHPIESAAGEQALGHVDSAERYGSMHLVTADGHRLAGGAALPELMALIPGAAAFAPVARAVPEWALERAYRMVADHRHTLSRLAGHARCGLR